MVKKPKQKPATVTSKPDLVLKPGQASIRMYRQGIGDCFLVRFPKQNSPEFFTMMIDCGAIDRTPDGAEFMNRVVSDIIAETGGTLDVLVLTHEHWDHLSGFTQAKEQFANVTQKGPARLKARQVWCAWTEDPSDQLALILKDGLSAARDKFAAGVLSHHQKMHAMGAQDTEASLKLNELLGFYGLDRDELAKDPSAMSGFAAGKKRASITGAAFDIAKATGPNIYRAPGEPPIELAGCEDVRVFILGPPKDPDALAKTDPRKAGYHMAFATNLALGGNPSAPDREATEQPFDHDVELAAHQHSTAEQWRQLPENSTEELAEFALMLDGATNNTSLVMAIELGVDGPVLLFVGDAQAGNWLSWEKVSWHLPGRIVTSADLLARTVFYKVGHHGSHNATLKEKGLELMTHKDLVSFVPVDRSVARLKRWGKMPLPSIIDELRRKTNNRTILSERAPPPKNDPLWTPDFKGDLREGADKLWFEITVPV